jgi:chemotaxis protein CheX
MPTELRIEVRLSELAQIVESVFATMLGLEAAECGKPWFPGADRLTSAVHLAGGWNGAVLLECDQRRACRFAGRFLSMDPFETVDNVVREVLGELANMIGGNLKRVLSQGIMLSMPSVMDGSGYSLRVCGSRFGCGLHFTATMASFG